MAIDAGIFTQGALIAYGLVGGLASIWYHLVSPVCLAIGLQMLGALSVPAPIWFGDLRRRIGWRGAPGALALALDRSRVRLRLGAAPLCQRQGLHNKCEGSAL
jgi:hypothetical protein